MELSICNNYCNPKYGCDTSSDFHDTIIRQLRNPSTVLAICWHMVAMPRTSSTLLSCYIHRSTIATKLCIRQPRVSSSCCGPLLAFRISTTSYYCHPSSSAALRASCTVVETLLWASTLLDCSAGRLPEMAKSRASHTIVNASARASSSD